MTKGHRRELEITFLLVGCWIFFMLMLYIDMYIHILTQLLSSVNSYVLGADATPDVSAITPSDAAHVKLLPIFLASSRTGILWRFNKGEEKREERKEECDVGRDRSNIEMWSFFSTIDTWHHQLCGVGRDDYGLVNDWLIHGCSLLLFVIVSYLLN